MRPILHPALSRTWRDESTLQVGATPGLALVVGGLSRPERAVVDAMTGAADLAALRELAAELGLGRSAADRLTALLVAAGAVVDGDRLAPADPPADPRRLPDRSSAALLTRSADGGGDVLAARGRSRVDVQGAGRVGAQIARLLAAAGVGTVAVLDGEPVRPADVSPGGHPPDAVGASRRRSLDPLLRADAGEADDGGRPEAPGLVVLAPTADTGRAEAAELVRQGIPHLFAQVVEVTGVVGPLVLPGRSSCLRCHDLHRTARDPHWPLVLDQALRRPPPEPACDAALAAVVAGLAATQVLAHLDGFTPAAVDGTMEVTLPSGLPRRRGWTRHPRCGCGWSTREDEAAQWEM
ncbi:hypothetical protein [Jiangella alkaliphila]|uniref:Molybdopterin or thiamine biosynthesis adenylyltransferase n=1 Tax=Jiangella alkaliphila TaxID=419479 RepID=A0A1H2JH13_9ACTN|nr:hypothetical protein [Jiangella alkaliphila]SDU55345.1 Molybdopterin or thiamine biosynthesis adenylyltransferase [Jiangella alkaliphila]